MKITLGSMSLPKLDAVIQANEILELGAEVCCVKTSSNQNEQPVGFEETFAGALARAKSAKAQRPDSIAIGIESGIFCFDGDNRPITLDIAIIVVLDNNDRQIISTSTGIQFPEEFVTIAKNRGFDKTTVGSIVAEKINADQNDPHQKLTNGRITRKRTLIEAVVTALKQL
jgi:non-canonical (house-cleaning) NTP pyrophosphatase